MPEKKTLNEDLFYKGSSANLPRLHMCENKFPFWDFKEFAITLYIHIYIYTHKVGMQIFSRIDLVDSIY